MSPGRKVIIYGANGYTGKLVAESLAQRQIPFYFAGRSRDKLEKALGIVRERLGASAWKLDAEIVAVDNSVETLLPVFRKCSNVINVAGPFMQVAWPVVEAALKAGCHYTDTTGEQDWTRAIADKFGAQFAAKGLLMAPAYAMPRMLARAGLTLQDFDFYEIHEAFASQVLATLKAWEDPIFCRERLGLDAPLGPIDPALLDLLHDVKQATGGTRRFEIISAYRSPVTNHMLASRSNGVADRSLHLQGQAIDVRLPGVRTADLRRAALQRAGGGVGYYPESDFVHIDTGRVRSW